MHTKKLMTLLLAVVLVLSLAACGAKGGDHMDSMDNEPKNAEEAAAMHKELTAQEAAILAENTALWEKVFMAKELSGKGGALIGINAFTLDGNEAAISDAKDVLTQSGATYQNVYFDSGSEAGKFVESIYAYPTTYVVNRSGRIVGDPIVGAITSKAQADALQAQIDKALAADMG